NLLALMVVWGYPCESKSSPAHYSNTLNLTVEGVFLCAGKMFKSLFLAQLLQSGIFMDKKSVKLRR
ncbi:hypothetical protein, partial [Acinetobacter lactucae]